MQLQLFCTFFFVLFLNHIFLFLLWWRFLPVFVLTVVFVCFSFSSWSYASSIYRVFCQTHTHTHTLVNMQVCWRVHSLSLLLPDNRGSPSPSLFTLPLVFATWLLWTNSETQTHWHGSCVSIMVDGHFQSTPQTSVGLVVCFSVL